MLATLTCALALTQALCAAPAGAPTVRTSGGEVYGTQLPASAGGKKVNQFLGLPFASAERFEPPVDFKGTYAKSPLNATMWGRACLQTGPYGTEDCLKANVWQPASDDGQSEAGSLKPVLVFIYGGSNQFGEAEPYNMSGISAFHDTVTVNFNYRTGPLGWMAFEEDAKAGKSTGNYGILDIQSALRWVQREARNFGGDPTRVAIHGQSSGGGLVELQYVSPASNKLFQGAISESGGLSAQSLSRALANTKYVANGTKCARSPTKACLKALDAQTLTDMTDTGDWGPTTDGVTFPDDPEKLLQDGKVNDASVILGFQTNDNFLFLSRDYTTGHLPQPNDHPDGALVHMNTSQYEGLMLGELGDDDARARRLLPMALALYPTDTARGGSINNVQNLGLAESDREHCGARRRAKLLDAHTKGSAFVYRFDYWYKSNTACTAVPNYHRDYLGPVHQDEVTFVMQQPNFMEAGSCCGTWGLSEGEESCDKEAKCTACYHPSAGREGYLAFFDDKEWKFAQTIGRFWTNFAFSRDPNTRTSRTAGVVAWPDSRAGAVVLSADLPGGSKVEKDVRGDAKICALWDAVAAQP